MPTTPSVPKPNRSPVRYEVRSVVSGETICGPYDSESDARRECKRLNREAAAGETEHPQPGFPDGRLNRRARPLMHMGEPVRYEVASVGGVTLGEVS